MNNNLHGGFKPDSNISGKLSPMGQLTGSISVSKSYEPYSGEYEVTPKAYEEQVLDTLGRMLKDNITIHEVPYQETHNESGITVYIG